MSQKKGAKGLNIDVLPTDSRKQIWIGQNGEWTGQIPWALRNENVKKQEMYKNMIK